MSSPCGCSSTLQSVVSQQSLRASSASGDQTLNEPVVVGCLSTSDGVRLVGGGSHCAGRVEVLHRGQWGTVCLEGWNAIAAKVVCRQLDCGEPLSIALAEPGSGQIWMSHVECHGSELTLQHCGSLGWGEHSCDHYRDVEIFCSGHRKSRLTGSPHLCSGRVEVFQGESWYTMCDADFDQQDAEVVCRELGCGLPVGVLGGAAFGRGEGQVWSEELQCRGYESEISLCPTSPSLKPNCTHDRDVGLICSGHTQARLVNGPDPCFGRVELQYLNSSLAFHEGRVRFSGGMECEGKVEVYFRQDWRRVLLDSWSESEASVVCRQLGCGSVFSFSGSSPSSPEHSHMCVMGFNCSGSEAHLRNCSSAQAVNCSSREQLYITCSGKNTHSSIRLVGSGGDCAGRLEVFHSGSWGTVCDDLWGIKDAQVVCRQLQCGVALSAPVPAQFGPGTGPILLNEVECEGNETSLWNCRFQMCEEDECEHKEDVGVVCSEYKEIRLTEGCEGNLEVFYNGTWGNVCVNDMNEETASLICQELNCGETGTESPAKARVESAPNWLDNLKCRKHDSTLWHCPSYPWGRSNCDNHKEVARITCSGTKEKLGLKNSLNFFSFPNQKQSLDHLPLRLWGNKGSCSGRLEVYHNTEWGSVCDEQWDIMDAQVVCRQLGCGPALSADGSSVFGAGNGTVWLSRVKCRGNEIHLWDCAHSLKNHTDCSHRQHAGVTCTVPQTGSTSVTLPQITLPAVPSIYLVPLLVLGVLLFLVLVLLVVLLYQNRRLRRVLSKRKHKTLTEAIYEEIDQRLITKKLAKKGSILSQHLGYEDADEGHLSGSILSESQHSGYEDVDEELLADPGKAVTGEKAEYYSTTAVDLKSFGTEEIPANYDDVMSAGQMPENVIGVFLPMHSVVYVKKEEDEKQQDGYNPKNHEPVIQKAGHPNRLL
ncbi:hypothetical protein NFI96_032557 [Prochilodus magdalenae]|nr:hypothetical protein NFI96_032557 [Prochilodus magdalenae]